MNWLDEVGPGWHQLVAVLVAEAERTGATIHQVKEKFGGLRFYVSASSTDRDRLIEAAEALSCYTCEQCGKPGQRRSGGWIRTLCEEHVLEQVN